MYYFIISDWLPGLPFLALGGWLLIRYEFLADRLSSGRCPKCGYDLRAHRPGEKCPECGSPVPTPKDPEK